MRVVLALLICLFSVGSQAAESLTDLTKSEQYLEVNPRLLQFTSKAKQIYIRYFDKNFNEIMNANEELRLIASGCNKEKLLEHINIVAEDIATESRNFAIGEIDKDFNDTELDTMRKFYLSPIALKLRIFKDKGLITDEAETELLTQEDKDYLIAYKESELGKKEAEFLDNTLISDNIIKIVSRKGFFGEEKLKCATQD